MAGSGLEGVLAVIPPDAQTQPFSPEWPSVVTLDPEEFELEGPLEDGVNGVWTLRDKTGKRWIFKPAASEAFRIESGEEITGNQGSMVMYDEFKKFPLKRGVRYGATCQKEVAAYLLDHENFAGVPRTYPARVYLPSSWEGSGPSDQMAKYVLHTGSLQEYQPHVDTAENIGTSRFSVEQVHKIGVLDVRLLNLDRHSGNLLVSEPGYELHPIDHGFSLPDFRETSEVTFEWLYWKQCKEKFSDRTLDYIKRLNPLKDAEMLYRNTALGPESALSCLLSTTLLKVAAEKGLTLFEIGSILQRKGCGDEPSVFERLVSQTLQRMESEGAWDWETVFNLDNSAAVLSLRDKSGGTNENFAITNQALDSPENEVLTLQNRASSCGIVCDSSNDVSASSHNECSSPEIKESTPSGSSNHEEKLSFSSFGTSPSLATTTICFPSSCGTVIEDAAKEQEEFKSEELFRENEVSPKKKKEGKGEKFDIRRPKIRSKSEGMKDDFYTKQPRFGAMKKRSEVEAGRGNTETGKENEGVGSNNGSSYKISSDQLLASYNSGTRKKGDMASSSSHSRINSDNAAGDSKGSDKVTRSESTTTAPRRLDFKAETRTGSSPNCTIVEGANCGSDTSPAASPASSTEVKKRVERSNRKKKDRRRATPKKRNKELIDDLSSSSSASSFASACSSTSVPYLSSGSNSSSCSNLHESAGDDSVSSKRAVAQRPAISPSAELPLPSLEASVEPLPPMVNITEWTAQPLLRSRSSGSWGFGGIPGPAALGRSRSSSSCDTVNIWKDVSKSLFNQLQAIVAEADKPRSSRRTESSKTSKSSVSGGTRRSTTISTTATATSATSTATASPTIIAGITPINTDVASTSSTATANIPTTLSSKSSASLTATTSASHSPTSSSTITPINTTITSPIASPPSTSSTLSPPISVASNSSRAWRSPRVAAAAAAKGVATALFGDHSANGSQSPKKRLSANSNAKLSGAASPREKEGGSDVRNKSSVSAMIGEALSQMKARRTSLSSNLPSSHETSLTRSGSNDGMKSATAAATQEKVLHPSSTHSHSRELASLPSSPYTSPSSLQPLSSPSGPGSLPFLDITEQACVSPPSSPPVSMRLRSPRSSQFRPPNSPPFSPPSSPPVSSPLSSPPSSPFVGEKSLQLEDNSANQWLQSFLTIFLELLEGELRPMCNDRLNV